MKMQTASSRRIRLGRRALETCGDLAGRMEIREKLTQLERRETNRRKFLRAHRRV